MFSSANSPDYIFVFVLQSKTGKTTSKYDSKTTEFPSFYSKSTIKYSVRKGCGRIFPFSSLQWTNFILLNKTWSLSYNFWRYEWGLSLWYNLQFNPGLLSGSFAEIKNNKVISNYRKKSTTKLNDQVVYQFLILKRESLLNTKKIKLKMCSTCVVKWEGKRWVFCVSHCVAH